MTNKYIAYYKSQAGTGISGFQGVRYQKGHGFFGRILSSAIYPLLRFLGKEAVSVGANLVSDTIVNKRDFKESAKDRLKEAAVNITNAGAERAKKFVLTGQGRRRKSIKRIKKGKVSKKRVQPKSIKRVKHRRKSSKALANLLKNASNHS